MKDLRKFNCKIADMLITSSTIGMSFKNNVGDFTVIQTNWTIDTAHNFINKVDNAIENKFGINPKELQFKASADVESIVDLALKDLSVLKTQIQINFRDSEKLQQDMLRKLGFDQFYLKATTRDQEALFQLLYNFKSNVEEYTSMLLNKGINQNIIDNLTGFAGKIKYANAYQEMIKKETAVATAENIKLYNEIYEETMDICKIGQIIYKDNPEKKAMFTFSKVLKTLNFKDNTKTVEQ